MLAPRIEVTESDKEIEISAELPGLERKDVDISLDRNLLTIRAEKKVEAEQKDKNVHMTERSYGVFYRVLELPTAVDPSTVQATMSNGVLKITIPKPPQAKPKRSRSKRPRDTAEMLGRIRRPFQHEEADAAFSSATFPLRRGACKR